MTEIPEPDRLADLRAEYANTGMVKYDGAVWLISQVVVLREQVQQLAAVPVPPPADQTALRDRIADALYALMLRNGWDGERTEPVVREMDLVLDAVLAVLPEQTDRGAEMERMRERHKASLRRADQLNNELMEEVQRYAAGAERPVLWSVYNRMHGRALEAEAKWKRLVAYRDALENARRITRTLAAHAVGFQDVLDDSDRDPWARMVRADIAALSAALAESSQGAEDSECEAEAELYVLLRKAGEDRRAAQALIDRHRAEVLRRVAAEEQPAKPDRCPHGCDTSICPCLACEAAEEQAAETQDSLPAWLYQRFMPDGVGWESLDADDRSHWDHQARAVRRAVARGGFKADAEQPAVGEQPETQEAPVLPCSYWTFTRTEHNPHQWEPQPGMDPVHCPGYSRTPE